MASRLLFGLFLTAFLSGCVTAPQQPIAFDPVKLPEEEKIGVLIDVVPAPQTSYPGAGCLLCLATAAAANTSLANHVKTFATDDLSGLDSHLVSSLNAAGYSAVVIHNAGKIAELPKIKSKAANASRYDFSRLTLPAEVNHLLVVEFEYVGVQRNYSSYIPTGAPQALVAASSYLVDLTSNTYKWYKPLKVYQSAEGEWYEPPTFPGMTNAYYQAIESVRDAIIQSFPADTILPDGDNTYTLRSFE